MNQITAVVLSKHGYQRRFRDLDFVVHHSVINNARDLCLARFQAVQAVRTPYFFYLDDDDDLPFDYLDVLNDCVAAGACVAYTDEIIVSGDSSEIRRSADYSQSLHLKQPLLIHHLALCRTADAREVARTLPVEPYCPEMILYWELAKRGAVYVPRVGYVWNRSNGMHTWTSTAKSWVRAPEYCEAHP